MSCRCCARWYETDEARRNRDRQESRMNRRVVLLAAVLIVASSALREFVLAQAPATCTVSGTIYKLDGTAAANETLRVGDVRKNGVLIQLAPITYTANGSGFITFNVIRGTTAKIYGNVAGFNVVGGVTVLIPDAASASLEGLVTVAAVPTSGLTIELNDTSASTGKFGTLDFSTNFTITESPTGEANIGITGVMTNPMTTLGDTLYGGASGAPTRLAGNTTTTRKFWRQVGDGAASAAPAWDTLQLGDLASGGTANRVLGVNSGGSGFEYKSLAVGTSGTDFNIAHAANSITLNLPDASASARGLLTTGTQTLAGAKTLTD